MGGPKKKRGRSKGKIDKKLAAKWDGPQANAICQQGRRANFKETDDYREGRAMRRDH